MRAQVDEIRVHWRESGRGEAVLFVHGFPFNGGQWEGQIERLPQRWRFLAPDLRGFGETEVGGGEGPLAMDLLADDLAAFLDSQEIERAVVCGLSMGGYIAFALWRWHRERVRALVLCDTRVGADTPEAKEKRRATAEMVRREGVGALAEVQLPLLLSAETRRERPEVAARVRELIESTPQETILSALQGLAERPDSTDLLPTITVPTLVVGGAEDAMTPPDELEALSRSIPGAHLQLIEGAGHLPNLENPVAFDRALVHFLEAIQGH